MLLQLVWPPRQAVLCCDTLNTENDTVFFCFASGEFVTQKPTTHLGYLSFFLQRVNVVLGCKSNEFQCYINGQPLQEQQNCALVFDMQIQAGHYLFYVMPDNQWDQISLEQQDIPELSDMLGYGGYYTAWDYNSEFIETNENSDELRTLNSEYNRRLIWGEHPKSVRPIAEANTLKVAEIDDYLDKVLDAAKEKTVSECIIDGKQSIDTIIESLPISDIEVTKYVLNDLERHDERLYEGGDILQILAPEELSSIERKYIADLTYSELKKTGLDSYI